MSKEYPWGKGTPTWTRDATANDSDKAFTVPAGKIWHLKSIYAQLVCTATVGTRLFGAVITNGTDTVLSVVRIGGTASQTVTYRAYFGAYDTTTVASNPTLVLGTPDASYRVSIPDLMLPAGYVIRIYDTAAIDAAADDMTVVLHYVEYDA